MMIEEIANAGGVVFVVFAFLIFVVALCDS